MASLDEMPLFKSVPLLEINTNLCDYTGAKIIVIKMSTPGLKELFHQCTWNV